MRRKGYNKKLNTAFEFTDLEMAENFRILGKLYATLSGEDKLSCIYALSDILAKFISTQENYMEIMGNVITKISTDCMEYIFKGVDELENE